MSEVREPRTRRTLLLLLAPCLLSTCLRAQYGGGTGEPNDPYLIYTPAQMNAIGAEPNDWDKHFKLMADLDLSDYTGAQFNVIGRVQGAGRDLVMTPFTGVFDGNDHTLSNFTWKSAGRDYVGIFGCVGAPAAEIWDLHIIDPNVTAEEGTNVGSLVGYLASGLITHCRVRGGNIAGDSCVGALAGTVSGALSSGRSESEYIPGGVITGCYADSNVAGNESVGGLVGSNAGPITGCDARGDIIGRDLPAVSAACAQGPPPKGSDPSQVISSSAIGGLVGSNWGTITDAHADANVAGGLLVGGLVGDNHAIIMRSYAGGSTTGTSATGNLVGQNREGTISDCNSTGTVNGGGQAGGLVGYQYRGKLENCRSSCSVTAQTRVGGLAGDCGFDTEITRCHASGAVTGTSYVGGLVGQSSGGTITHCGASGMVAGSSFVGGLVGMGFAGGGFDTIEDCYASGAVTGNEDVGGLVGHSGSGPTAIRRCRATGDVTGDERVSRYLGGLVGNNSASISSSYATGTVCGAQYLGGLVGYHGRQEITNCYSRGMVWGTQNVGGFAGCTTDAIVNCYATGLVVGSESLGGFAAISATYGKTGVVGSFWDMQTTRQATSAAGAGKSTLKMQSAAAFLYAGWDFVGETANGVEDIWWIVEGRDYPRLAWELDADDSAGDEDSAATMAVSGLP
jgi:hypothetical protein